MSASPPKADISLLIENVRLAMYEPATDMLDFFSEIGVPMTCCTDPIPVGRRPSSERIAAVLKKHKIEILEGTV